MLFTTTSLFALSFVHASVAVSIGAQPTDATLERRGCTPKKSPTPGPAAPVTFDAFDVNTAQQYRYQKQAGNNLGSWFVHEAWMNNDPYSCATGPKSAEIDIARGWGGVEGAQTELEYNWDTWITESYIEQIAAMGVNTVRLPIGYWSLGKNWTVGTPFEDYGDAYVNSWSRVLRTVKWCETHKIGVLIDLHGAPGSQNGQAHSGISDGKIGLWGNQKNIQLTQKILVWLAEQFQYVNNVIGLELLNEPKYGDDLLNFYKETIPMVRAVAKTMPIYLHDGFQLNNMANWVVDNCDKWQPIIVDNHHYYVFQSALKSKPITSITSQINSSDKSNLASNNKKLNGNLIIGEMGCANADGQTVSNMDSALKAYCEAQINVYSGNTAGWIFWSLKTAGCSVGSGDGWCFIGSVGKYLPKNFVVPSGTISSGGVTITPGSGPTNGDGSDSGDNTSGGGDSTSTSSSSASTPSSSSSSSGSGSGSGSTCSANGSNNKRKRHNKRALGARALDNSADMRRRHHVIKREIASDRGYTEGHIAANNFISNKRALGMPHAFIKARMEHLNMDEELFEHFKRGFEEGHDEAVQNWARRR